MSAARREGNVQFVHGSGPHVTKSARRRRTGGQDSQHLTISGQELDQMRPFTPGPLD
jgi:hypothetical protein